MPCGRWSVTWSGRALLDDGRVNAAWLENGGRLPMPVAAVGGGLSLGDRVARDIEPVAPDLRGDRDRRCPTLSGDGRARLVDGAGRHDRLFVIGARRGTDPRP